MYSGAGFGVQYFITIRGTGNAMADLEGARTMVRVAASTW